MRILLKLQFFLLLLEIVEIYKSNQAFDSILNFFLAVAATRTNELSFPEFSREYEQSRRMKQRIIYSFFVILTFQHFQKQIPRIHVKFEEEKLYF